MDQFERDVWGAKQRLMNYVMRQIGHVDDAEDIVSHTMLRALAYRDKFDGRNLEAWLTTIAKNLIRDRHNKGFRKQTRTGAARMTFTDDPNYADHIVATDNPERALIVAEAWNELSNLPDKQAEVVVMRGLGCTYAELTAMTGAALGTVKSRIHRAREALIASGALSPV